MRCFFTTCFIAFILFLSCGIEPTESSKSMNNKIQSVESLLSKQPSANVDYSMDRDILNMRLKRMNDPNKMTYLYVILIDGTWLKVTIIGKMASTSKRVSPRYLYRYDYHPEELPDEMGTWGSSNPAHVGITTLGSLLEIGGMLSYLYSEVPLNFSNMNKVVAEITVEATSEEKKLFLKDLNNIRR